MPYKKFQPNVPSGSGEKHEQAEFSHTEALYSDYGACEI